MNGQQVIDDVSTFTPRATQLLSEYTQKFASMLDRVKRLFERSADDELLPAFPDKVLLAEVRAVEEWYTHMSPAARRFAQQVSGMIDQGRISPLDKAELQLRLAEFETALLGFPNLMNAYRAQAVAAPAGGRRPAGSA